MSVSFVIAEYNPFHNGHCIQLNEIKRVNDAPVIAVMSGNFVQRGGLAVCDKYARAEAAVKSGVDVCLELPYPFSCGSAEDFAFGAVGVVKGLGVDGMLFFGSESGDIEKLTSFAERSVNPALAEAIKENKGKSHEKAYENAFHILYGEDAFFPKTPNDILGCEYIRAIGGCESITPFTYARKKGFSAGKARELFRAEESVASVMPDTARVITESIEKHGMPDEKMFFGMLASALCGENTRGVAYMNGGMYGRIMSAAEKARDFSELVSLSTCGKYTAARVRRALVCALLKITGNMMKKPPENTMLLGASERGLSLLNRIKKIADIEIITKPSKCEDPIQDRADGIYALLTGRERGYFAKQKPYIAK